MFGKTWVDRQSDPLLTLGNRKWTRYELVSKIGVGNFRAVTILLDALQRLGIHTLDDLKGVNPLALAAVRGVGTTTLFVVMSLLDSEGVNATTWYTDSRVFSSLKREQEKAKMREKREARASKRRRKLGGATSVPRRRRLATGLRELPQETRH